MAKAPKLNDLQLILLSIASRREEGNLLPLAKAAAQDVLRARKDIRTLLKRGLAAEAATTRLDRIWREEDDQRFTVIITDTGREAIGLETEPTEGEANRPAERRPEAPDAAKREPRSGSKKALLIDMLQRPEGASLIELTEMTGWLPHTTRAAITGVRKTRTVTTSKVDNVTRYRVEVAE